MIFNSKHYILRKEFFGGLLVDKRNLTRFEINEYDAVFLEMLSKGDFKVREVIKKMNTFFSIDYQPNIEEFLKMQILLTSNKEETLSVEPMKNEQSSINYLSYPNEISIYPSLKCNLNCSFCFLGDKLNTNYQEKGANEWFDLIEEAVNNGCLSVSILGGEPLLYYDILKLVQLLEASKIRTTITSNGLCWNKNMIEFIQNSQYITPIFSIQSLDDFNKLVMGKSHNINRWIKTVTEISKYRKVRVNTVYLGQSIDDLKKIIDFCHKNNVEKYSLAYKYDVSSDWKSFKEIIDVQDQLENYREKKCGNEHLHFSVEGCMIYSAYENIDGGIVESSYQQLIYGCEAGNSRLEIIPNGEAFPCISFFENDLSCGNVFNSSIKKIWHESTLLEELRNGKTNDKRCLNCSCISFCNGGCPMVNLARHKTMFDKGDPRCLIRENVSV